MAVYGSSQLCCLRLNRNPQSLTVLSARSRKKPIIRISRSILKSNIGNNSNGGTEPARVLLERLFAQTQKLEEQMSKDAHFSGGVSIDLEILESDLQNALTSLRKKEEDLQNAERAVLLDQAELNLAKQELEQREQEIATACAEHKKMEEDLERASNDLISRARQIEDLKLLVEEQNEEIVSAQSVLSFKEDELNKLRDELTKKHEEADRISSNLESRDQLLYEANATIERQETTIQELQKSLSEKEQELAASMQLNSAEQEKLKVAEANLEKRTLEWLSQQEELKKLAKEASKHVTQTKVTLEDFNRVWTLLVDVRSELVSSQKSLASSRRKMEDQGQQLERQLTEVNELKLAVMLYTESLKQAYLEVETERNKLGVEQARNMELERQLATEQQLVGTLEQELNKERASFEQVTQEIALLREDLEQKMCDFDRAQNLLELNESELVEARMQIQHLKSVQSSLQLILEEKDVVLSNAQAKLADLDHEVDELKKLMSGKEDQLIQATARLQEKEEHLQVTQIELDDTKVNLSEAQSVVERIAQLTNELVISAKDDGKNITAGLVIDKPIHNFVQKEVVTELEMMKESLRAKDIEVMVAKRALAAKEEELKVVLNRLGVREKEMKEMREEWADRKDLKKLYALVEERIDGKSIGDLAIERLELEAAHLEVEAATSALRNLAVMSGELLKETKTALNFGDSQIDVFQEKAETAIVPRMNSCTEVAHKEVARLAALTEKLVKEASITNTME